MAKISFFSKIANTDVFVKMLTPFLITLFINFSPNITWSSNFEFSLIVGCLQNCPPSFSRSSIKTVFTPQLLAAKAALRPPIPPPIINKSG